MFDPYILERMAKTRLAELRADGARWRLLASLKQAEPGARSTVRVLLLRAGRLFGRRATVRPRPA